jgi:hypothetical protein
MEFDSYKIKEYAKKFDKNNFRENLLNFIEDKIKN